MEVTEILSESCSTRKFGVKFRYFDKVYPIEILNMLVVLGDGVVVETNRGEEFGVIDLQKDLYCKKKATSDIVVKRIIRKATPEDIEKYNNISAEEQEVFIQCIKKNAAYHYPLKFFKVEKIFDGRKYIVFYKHKDQDNKKNIKPKKVNYQSLINELNTQYQARFEFREVGPRGEAKIFGGVGDCGKTLCCVNWNKKGSNVSVKMAKEQGLAINIPKLSGVCGRLLCCLSYEAANYEDREFKRD